MFLNQTQIVLALKQVARSARTITNHQRNHTRRSTICTEAGISSDLKVSMKTSIASEITSISVSSERVNNTTEKD